MPSKNFNPIATLLRTIGGPEGNGAPHHSSQLARHFMDRDRPTALEDQLDMAEYMLGAIQTPEQAQEAIEWMVARWPATSIARVNYSDGNDNNIEALCERAEVMMDAMIDLGADLDLPFSSETGVPRIIGTDKDGEETSLAETLVLLGHTKYTPRVRIPLTGERLSNLVKACAWTGDFLSCNYLAEKVSEKERDDLHQKIWRIASHQTNPALDQLHLLDPPPLSWWGESVAGALGRNSSLLRAKLVEENPAFRCIEVQAMMHQGKLHLATDQHLAEALSLQSAWTTPSGTVCSALEAAIAGMIHIVDEGREPGQQLISTQTSDLIQRLGHLQPGNFSASEWAQIAKMAARWNESDKRKTPASGEIWGPELLTEMLGRLPKTPGGAPDPHLCILLGLASASAKEFKKSDGSRLGPALRSLLFQEAPSPGTIYDTGKAAASLLKSFTFLAPEFAGPDIKELTQCKSQQYGNQLLEFTLWKFFSSRVNLAKSVHDINAPSSTQLLRTQVRHASEARSLIEAGYRPEWCQAEGQYFLDVLSTPFFNTPPELLSDLQKMHLDQTPQAQGSRARVRI